jgi:hypothetical protein
MPASIANAGATNFEGCQTLTIRKQKLLSIYNTMLPVAESNASPSAMLFC